jgi:hypothetical protein
MGSRRAQIRVGNRRTARCQVDIGQRGAVATGARRAGRQTKQEVWKGKEEDRSVRVVRAVFELVLKDLDAKTESVSASRQRDRIGKVQVIVGGLVFVIGGIANLERAQDLNVRQASLRRIVGTSHSHRLSRQRTWRRTSAGDA